MGNVTAIPEGKGTLEEKAEFEAFRNGEENLYEAGINVGKPGFYDPEAGSKYAKEPQPDRTEGPLLATDPGQPERVGEAKVISRQSNPAVDKSEVGVVRSARKTKPKE